MSGDPNVQIAKHRWKIMAIGMSLTVILSAVLEYAALGFIENLVTSSSLNARLYYMYTFPLVEPILSQECEGSQTTEERHAGCEYE